MTHRIDMVETISKSAAARSAVGAAVSRRLRARRSVAGACLIASFVALSAGCATTQEYGNVTVAPNITGLLKPGDLEAYGLAFITPASVTGQEEDRPALALIFSEVLAELRPTMRIVPLDETLSDFSRAGASEDFNRMVVEYRESGLLNRTTLAQVSRMTGVRYIAQLKMASFKQEAQERFSIFGVRIIQTKKADIRLFLRIWDGHDGSIAWEGAQELDLSRETVSEKDVTFKEIVTKSARAIIARIP